MGVAWNNMHACDWKEKNGDIVDGTKKNLLSFLQDEQGS